MKTKNLFFLLTLFAALSVSAQDSVVVINGVRWATRNVDAPGTFAKNPEDSGMFYQWNSKVGWYAKGSIDSITASDGSNQWNRGWRGGFSSPSASDTWTKDNDPCPSGYCIPTYEEIESLLDKTKVTSKWIIQGGVVGRKFTDIATGNYIFLPALGYRSYYDGTLDFSGSGGFYWSSTVSDRNGAYGMDFGSSDTSWHDDFRANGISIRPVAE